MNRMISTQQARSAIQAAPLRPTAPILSRNTVASRALMLIVAVMTFLAALAIGVVSLVHDAAGAWQSDLQRELTIQVRPLNGRDLAADLSRALELAKSTRGVEDATILPREATARLLEPWLGSFDFRELPLPRLLVVRLATGAAVDVAGLRRTLAVNLPNATLDDHRAWSDRIGKLVHRIVAAGIALIGLVLAATMLAISFATNAAVAANRAVVETLHIVGARDSFIAGAFQRHFLSIGLQGGMIGGGAAAILFASSALVQDMSAAASEPEVPFLFGRMVLGGHGYAGIALIVALVAMATTLTSRLTVRRTLRRIE